MSWNLYELLTEAGKATHAMVQKEQQEKDHSLLLETAEKIDKVYKKLFSLEEES